MMKIISKFSDYYDCGLAYGVDEKLCFVRETKELSGARFSLWSQSTFMRVKEGKMMRIILHYKLMGFCGKIYPFVYVLIEEVVKKNKEYLYKPNAEFFYYDMNGIEEFRREFLNINPLKGYRTETYFKLFNCDYSGAATLFEKYKVPYFLIEGYKDESKDSTRDRCVLLPCLKTYKFVKVKEPLQAFQEISMYLGALGLGENKYIMIEDKYLTQSKGYDCYSFKKMPKKRKRKKC